MRRQTGVISQMGDSRKDAVSGQNDCLLLLLHRNLGYNQLQRLHAMTFYYVHLQEL